MPHLKTLIEQEFNKVKKEAHSDCPTANKLTKQEDVSDLKREIAALEEIVDYLTPYKGMFQSLAKTLYSWLLYGRVKIEEIP